MFLFTILIMIAVILLAFTVLTISIGGAAFIIIFADVIVCVVLIALVIKALTGKKKKK